MRIAVLTVSDAGVRGERVDSSGGAIVTWAVRRGDLVTARSLVADDSEAIVSRLIAWCDEDAADLGILFVGEVPECDPLRLDDSEGRDQYTVPEI